MAECDFCGKPEHPLGDVAALAARIMEWLRADIAEGGGTGRRLGRIEMGLGTYCERPTFRKAIKALEDDGSIKVEEMPQFGFVYAIPLPDPLAPSFSHTEEDVDRTIEAAGGKS